MYYTLNIILSHIYIIYLYYIIYIIYINIYINIIILLIYMIYICVLYVQTNSVHHIYGISNLHYDFKKQVLINNCSVLFIFNFIVLFSHI